MAKRSKDDPDPLLAGIAQRIQTLRRRGGHTQKELGDRVGVSDQYISKWERGQGLSLHNVIAVAKALDVSTDMVLRGEDWAGPQEIAPAPAVEAALARRARLRPIPPHIADRLRNWTAVDFNEILIEMVLDHLLAGYTPPRPSDPPPPPENSRSSRPHLSKTNVRRR